MLTMDDIIREGHPTLRARAEKIAFPLSDEDLKLAHDLMEFLKTAKTKKSQKNTSFAPESDLRLRKLTHQRE